MTVEHLPGVRRADAGAVYGVFVVRAEEELIFGLLGRKMLTSRIPQLD
jgi:hypothetical protein